jgi:hypothetical protein
MKVINNKTKKEYSITDDAWKKLKEKGMAGRFSVIAETKAFQPKELKIEIKK